MKQKSANEKTSQRNRQAVEQAPSAGSNGIAIAPPAYGMGAMDHGLSETQANSKTVIQRKAADTSSIAPSRLENRTGLPDSLKAGIESLSGLALDNVRVHYNSFRPARLHALAYTQGAEIHVAPGQERHLPHEAWHVVQQKQGRVRPTMQLKGKVQVNNDDRLEHEADMMGDRAAKLKYGMYDSKLEPKLPVGNTLGSTALTREGKLNNKPFNNIVQARFELIDPDSDDNLYAWEDEDDDTASQGEFVYCGYWVSGNKHLFVQSDDQEYKYVDQWTFYDQKGISYTVHDFKGWNGKIELSTLVDNAQHRLRRYEPEGGIGNLDFRFEAGRGDFYSSNASLCKQVEDRFDDVNVVCSSFWMNYYWAKYMTLGKLGYFPYADERIGRDFVYIPARYRDPRGNSTKNQQQGGPLPPPDKPPQEVTYKQPARRAARGRGQQAVMQGWNAFGYAVWEGMENPIKPSTDWEWLHIRGSRIGGKNKITNLVAGTHGANSAMIPWERKVQRMSELSDNNHPVKVKWTATTKENTHIGDKVTISLEAPNGLIAGDYKNKPIPKTEKTFDATLGARVTKLDRDLVNAFAFIPSRME